MFKERFDQSDRYWYGIKGHFDQQGKKLDEIAKDMSVMNQRVQA